MRQSVTGSGDKPHFDLLLVEVVSLARTYAKMSEQILLFVMNRSG